MTQNGVKLFSRVPWSWRAIFSAPLSTMWRVVPSTFRGELAAVCGRSGPHLKKRADLQQRAIYRLQLLVGILPPSRIPLSSSFACRRCQGKHVARTQATLRNEAQGAHHIVQGALRATFAQYWQREPRADEALGDLLVTLF